MKTGPICSISRLSIARSTVESHYCHPQAKLEFMDEAPTFYLASQTNFGNRGCEALVRSTVSTLRAAFGTVNVLVPSLDIERDKAQWPESARSGVEFVQAPAMPWALSKWSGACRRFPSLASFPHPKLSMAGPCVADMQRADAILSIGGDSYSLDYGLAGLYFNMAIADAAMATGKPTLLWGASVGPFGTNPRVVRRVRNHLRRLALVTVRESHSLAYLHGLGISENVVQVADSAFALEAQSVDAQAWWPAEVGDGVVGLNIGFLIDHLRKQSGNAQGVVGEAAHFVREVMNRTGYAVVLVPHVAPLDGAAFNNDEVFNDRLIRELGGAGRRLAQVPGGLNAAQIKHVISRCRFFIGGRTHATIAAFSSGVPTLSIAYSVKAKGINRDLFGDERYVLETPRLAGDTLRSGLELLERDESAIRERYAAVLPVWRERAHAGAHRLAALLMPTRAAA